METEKQDRTRCCYMGYVEISHVASFRENRLSDPSFRRDRPQNRTQIVESQALTCRIQLALLALFSAWFTNAGSGVTLGAEAWTLDGGRSRLRRPIRSGFLFSGFRRWGRRLAIRGPFRCKHRIKHRKRRPGHQGPRVGAACPATTSPATRLPPSPSGMSLSGRVGRAKGEAHRRAAACAWCASPAARPILLA